MSLITRTSKGSKLTIQEMDANLNYLNGSYLDLGNSSTTSTIDWSQARVQELNVDNNPTLTFQGGVPGKSYKLLLKQPSLGKKTIIWPNNVVWNTDLTQSLSEKTFPIPYNLMNDNGLINSFPLSHSIALKPDGKIVVSGDFTTSNNESKNRIMQFNADGSNDATFDIGTGFANPPIATAVQSDGKIIAVGGFTLYNNTAVNRIVRLNTNGSIDSGFASGTGLNGSGSAVTVQSDGKILIAGIFTTYNGTSRPRLARLNTDGTLDTGFNPGTGPNNISHKIVTQSDNKILIGGDFTTFNSVSRARIARLNEDGTLDTGFVTGTGFNSTVADIAIQSDGKILVAGNFTTYNGVTANRIVRLNTDGTLDNSFSAGTASSGIARILVQSDNKVIVVGSFTTWNSTTVNRIIRLNTDGSLDSSFSIGTGPNANITTILKLNDNDILIGGSFTSFNNIPANRLVKLSFTDTPIYDSFDFEYNGTNYIAY